MWPQPMKAKRGCPSDFMVRSIPFLAAIFRHDAAEAVNIRAGEFFPMVLQLCPGIPLGAEQLAGDAIAFRRGQPDAEAGPEFERRRTLVRPFLVFRKKSGAH